MGNVKDIDHGKRFGCDSLRRVLHAALLLTDIVVQICVFDDLAMRIGWKHPSEIAA